MSHSLESIDALIREGTSLKNKIGMIARNLEHDANECKENLPCLPEKGTPAPELITNNISFITPLPGGLETTIADIFSMICSFDGIDHGGIYIFNRWQRQLDLVCHYNMPDEFLARVITFNRDSWQVNALFKDSVDFNDFQRIPLHVKIAYEQRGIHAIALIPLIHQGQVIGCMNLASQKEVFVNGFEKLVIEGLAMRISRTVVLHLAQVKLTRANEGLSGFMANLRAGFQLVIQPSEPEPINWFFAGMKDEIDGLCKAISLATEKILQKLKDGQRRHELPFLQKKVDAMLHDIDLIMQIIGRLRVFCNSQSATIERGMLQHNDTNDAAFLNSMADFYRALELLVMDEKKQESANAAFIAGQFKPLNRPLKLTDLKFRINRLTPN